MFPTGTAGVALFFLRVLVAITFVVDGSIRWSLVTSLPMFLLFTIPAIFLGLGLFTPYLALFCVIARAFLLFTLGSIDVFHLTTSGLMSAALGLLGPGAYSLDAVLFGRRRLVVPTRS